MANGIEKRRDLDVVPFVGAFVTDDFLSAQNRTQFISGMVIQMFVVSHGGYFVEGFLGPSQRDAFSVFTRPDGSVGLDFGYQSGLLGAVSAGPFVQLQFKSIDVGYRFGYMAAGDGGFGAEFFMHGLTFARTVNNHWNLRLDLRQAIKNKRSVGLGYSIGFGRRF